MDRNKFRGKRVDSAGQMEMEIVYIVIEAKEWADTLPIAIFTDKNKAIECAKSSEIGTPKYYDVYEYDLNEIMDLDNILKIY